MRNVTIEAIRVNPGLLSVLEARARRARAEATHNLFARLLGSLTPRLQVRKWGTHWG